MSTLANFKILGVILSGAGLPVDPDGIYYESFHSSLVDTTNESGYANPAFDRLVEEARSTLDLLRR
jgi:ABC-type transport system substrate-binding protein